MLSENSAFMSPEPPDRETTSKNKTSRERRRRENHQSNFKLDHTHKKKKRTILIKLAVSQLNSWSGKWFGKKTFHTRETRRADVTQQVTLL